MARCTIVALCTFYTCCPSFLTYQLGSVCTHFFFLILNQCIQSMFHAPLPPCATAGHSSPPPPRGPPMCHSFFIFIPRVVRACHPLSDTLTTTFIHIINHPHPFIPTIIILTTRISSYSHPLFIFFSSLLTISFSPLFHLSLFCNIMVTCSFVSPRIIS